MRDRSLQPILLRYLGVRLLMVTLVPAIFSVPATVPLMAQPRLAQTQNSQEEELRQLLQQAEEQTEQGQPRQAIETLQQALARARQLQVKELEAVALLSIGSN